MMSPKYRYLNLAWIVSVLFLMFAPNAAAESAKEQLQGTIDHLIEVLQTIHSPDDIETKLSLLAEHHGDMFERLPVAYLRNRN
jgi:hypothetical protein